MKSRIWVALFGCSIVVAGLVALLVFAAYKKEERAHQVARQEIFALPSINLSDTDFLNGKQAGTPVTLGALLRLPRKAGMKLPAVILLHGSGGMNGSGHPVMQWTEELNAMGIATLAVDSFASRGIVETLTDQNRLGRLNMIVDAYRALELLAAHRLIDPKRIVLMGFSRGAQSSLYSSMKRFHKMHGPKDLKFAGYISMYPSCNTAFRGEEDVYEPIRIFYGTADDFTYIGPCQSYVDRLRKAGKDIELIAYPGVHHTFDAPRLDPPVVLEDATTTRECAMAENGEGVVLNQATQKPFSYSDACVKLGPTVAFDEKATREARIYVRDFLKKLFALK